MNIIVQRFNDEVIASATSREELLTKLAELYEFDISETNEDIINFEGMRVLQSTKDLILAQRAEAERLRIAQLSMTGADVERAIYQAKGIDFEDILTLVKSQENSEQAPNIDLKALKIELKANNFYRGNPYINQIGELLGFTSEQLDQFFETKDIEALQ